MRHDVSGAWRSCITAIFRRVRRRALRSCMGRAANRFRPPLRISWRRPLARRLVARGAHPHESDDDFGGKSHIEQRWGTTFVNVAGLTRYHGSPETLQSRVPRSWLLTFTEGSTRSDCSLLSPWQRVAPQVGTVKSRSRDQAFKALQDILRQALRTQRRFAHHRLRAAAITLREPHGIAGRKPLQRAAHIVQVQLRSAKPSA